MPLDLIAFILTIYVSISPCVPMGIIICWALHDSNPRVLQYYFFRHKSLLLSVCLPVYLSVCLSVSDRIVLMPDLDGMRHEHQAVEGLDIVHGPTVKRLCDKYQNQYTPLPAPAQKWKQKNPGIT